ncbi:MAG: glutathione S-transferase family protein [Hyphomicrobiales bacterium]|nr:MAG: glutathione S-transferase family protein [Hyphomicrobiales bacterium]
MSLTLYAHPFSSYCQKVLVALYENATPFTYRKLGPDDPAAGAEWARLWPMKHMPVLVDGATPIVESSVIIEHLGLFHPGPVQLVPADAKQALGTRMMDRFFDNDVMTPMQAIVSDHLRPADDRDPYGVARARAKLDDAYRWLDGAIAERHWACGDAFSLADCAAAPSLFYADWVHEIDASFGHVRAYRARLLARPSFARAVEEARPFRNLFPPGAPDRD